MMLNEKKICRENRCLLDSNASEKLKVSEFLYYFLVESTGAPGL